MKIRKLLVLSIFAIFQLNDGLKADTTAVTIPVINHPYNSSQEWLAIAAGKKKADILSYTSGEAGIEGEFYKRGFGLGAGGHGFQKSDIAPMEALQDPSINVALQAISSAKWNEGIYFQLFAYNNKLYLVVFDKDLHVYSCITGLTIETVLPDKTAWSDTNNNVAYTGSYVTVGGKPGLVVTPYDTTAKQWNVLCFSSGTDHKSTLTLDEIYTAQSKGLALESDNNNTMMIQQFKQALKAGTVANIS